MKKLLLLLLIVPALVMAQKTPNGVLYDAQILRVTDGDTVVIAAPFLPAPLKPELAVRVYGVDTPEKGFRGQCDSEKARGEAALRMTGTKGGKKLVSSAESTEPDSVETTSPVKSFKGYPR